MSLCSSRRRRRRAAASILRLALLAAPVLFWAVVFAALAGVSPAERAVEGLTGAAQVPAAVACPLVAVLLGCGALRGGAAGRGASAGRFPPVRKESGEDV
ncbi:MAG TPA: hypothetical protein VEY09_13185 [Pyrinomonadaceae bacterium]|nr:hypothetical protein [Pyrinomonadaceae bacterium]